MKSNQNLARTEFQQVNQTLRLILNEKNWYHNNRDKIIRRNWNVQWRIGPSNKVTERYCCGGYCTVEKYNTVALDQAWALLIQIKTTSLRNSSEMDSVHHYSLQCTHCIHIQLNCDSATYKHSATVITAHLEFLKLVVFICIKMSTLNFICYPKILFVIANSLPQKYLDFFYVFTAKTIFSLQK